VIDWWQALLLSLVQGLTEFLPISSSAHLLLPSLLLGWTDQGLAFDVAVHVGTLLAVLLYFRATLMQLLRGVYGAVRSGRWNSQCQEVLYLAIASLPVAVAGVLLNDSMEALRSVPVVITTTLVFALLLALADRRGARRQGAGLRSAGGALVIGLAQVFALIPGTSRSGVTITAGLFLGLSREAASRFAFLLSIPVIFGAGLLKSLELSRLEDTPWELLGGAVLVSALSAYACIALFLSFIERVGMMPFVIYRVLLGGLLLLFWLR
jgi:undecaprenyl-diphosphatase